MNDDNHGDPIKQRRVAEHYLASGSADTAKLHRTAALAARVLDFPIGQINILDDRFSYTIGDFGTGLTRLPRTESMCQFLVVDGVKELAVDDLREHARYRSLAAVRTGVAGSYLGVPLSSREATTVGSLCVVDSRPRHITETDIVRMHEFGEIVEDQIELMRRNSETPASREISALIAQALDRDEFVPWYQPVVDLNTGRRAGFEALARWQRPDGAVVNPEAFVGAAEDSDLVVDLDRAVVRAALRDLARWRRQEPSMRMGVNLSTRHLELSDGATFVVEAARDAGVDPATVVVEITETRLLSDVAGASAAVRELRSAGFRVTLDDFANGWSGLDWLIGLGATGVKVDRSIATALGTPVGDAACRAVVGLAGELGMITTIEGLETAADLAAARAHGFSYGQGYHWSPPVPAVVVDAVI